jgi:deoxycytidylate deaminase
MIINAGIKQVYYKEVYTDKMVDEMIKAGVGVVFTKWEDRWKEEK